MTYRLIHDTKDLERFCDLLLPDAHYLVMVIVKKSYQSKQYKLKSMILRRELTTGSDVKLTIQRFQTPIGTYVDDNGVSIEECDLAVYCTVNPRDMEKVGKELAIEVIKGTTRTNLVSEVNRLAHKYPAKRQWFTVDVDYHGSDSAISDYHGSDSAISDYHGSDSAISVGDVDNGVVGATTSYRDVMAWLYKLFDKQIVDGFPKYKTKRGYHILVHSPIDNDSYQIGVGRLFSQGVPKGVELIRDCMEPVPGCMQSGHEIVWV
jgi:hypothetical protein